MKAGSLAVAHNSLKTSAGFNHLQPPHLPQPHRPSVPSSTTTTSRSRPHHHHKKRSSREHQQHTHRQQLSPLLPSMSAPSSSASVPSSPSSHAPSPRLNLELLHQLASQEDDLGKNKAELLEELRELRRQTAHLQLQRKQAEEANARLAETMDCMTEAACLVDRKGRIIFLNSSAYRLLGIQEGGQGRSGGNMEGRCLWDRCPSWAREVILDCALPYATQKGSWSGRIAITHATRNHEIPVSLSLQPIRTSSSSSNNTKNSKNNRATVFYSCVMKDISDRTLQTSICCYNDLIRHVNSPMAVWHLENPGDLQSFRLIAANQPATRLVGLPMEIGKTLRQTVPDNVNIGTFFTEVLRCGKAVDVEGFSLGNSPVLSVRAFPLQANCIGVAFGGTDASTSSAPSSPVIDSVPSASSASASSPSAAKDLNIAFQALEGAPVAVCFISGLAHGATVIRSNAALASLFGCSQQELQGQCIFSFCSPTINLLSLREVESSMTNHRECFVELTMHHRSSAVPPRSMHLSLFPICKPSAMEQQTDSVPAFMLIFNQNHSPFRPAKQEEDAEMKAELFSNIVANMSSDEFSSEDCFGSRADDGDELPCGCCEQQGELDRCTEPAATALVKLCGSLKDSNDTDTTTTAPIINNNDDSNVQKLYEETFASMQIPLTLWLQERNTSPSPQHPYRYKLLSTNDYVNNLRTTHLSGRNPHIGKYFDELATPAVVSSGISDAFDDIMATPGKLQKPIGLIPVKQSGYKDCHLCATGFAVSSNIFAMAWEEAHPEEVKRCYTKKAEEKKEEEEEEEGTEADMNKVIQCSPEMFLPLFRKVNSALYLIRSRINSNKNPFQTAALTRKTDVNLNGKRPLSSPSSSSPKVSPLIPIATTGSSSSSSASSKRSRNIPFRISSPARQQQQQPSSLPSPILPSLPLVLAGLRNNLNNLPQLRPLPSSFSSSEDNEKETNIKKEPATTSNELLQERLRAQQAEFEMLLRTKEQEEMVFKRCFHATPIAAALFNNKDGKLQATNPKLNELLGYSSTTALLEQNKGFEAFVLQEDLPAVSALPYNMVASGCTSGQILVLLPSSSGAAITHLLALLQPVS
ncbi:hypothetical protein QOT17_015184 [Balamuthia mandrillaris]